MSATALDQMAALSNIQNALLVCQQEANLGFDPERVPIIRVGAIRRLGEAWVFGVSLGGELIAQVGRPFYNDTFRIHEVNGQRTFQCDNLELVLDGVQYIVREIVNPVIDREDIAQATATVELLTGKKVKLVDREMDATVGQAAFGEKFADVAAHDTPPPIPPELLS